MNRQLIVQGRTLLMVYIALVVFSGVLLESRLFIGEFFPLPFQLMLALLIVLSCVRVSGYWLLAAIQVYLILREPSSLTNVAAPDVYVLAALSLTVVIFSQRCQLLLRSMGAQRLLDLPRLLSFVLQPESDNSATAFSLLSSLVCGALVTLGSAICAALALTILDATPLIPDSARSVRLMPSALRAIQLGFLLFVTYLVVLVFMSEFLWRRISAVQATLYLRVIQYKWLYRDLKLVSRARWRKNRPAMNE